MVRGHHECADARLRRRVRGQPRSQVARGGGFLDAADARTGGDEGVEHRRHAEDRGVQQRSPAGHAAGVGRRERLQVGAGGDELACDVGVAVARRGDQGRLAILGLTVDGGSGGEQRTCDRRR